MNPILEPTLEQLAAYFDGELPTAQRVFVETWLADHPDAQAELESLRLLHDHYQGVAVPEPSPAAWESTRQRIVADLSRARPRFWTLGLILGTLAASILGLVFLGGIDLPEDTTPFPVVSPDEVRILSMNPDDHGALVGVRPLLLNEIDLATHNDIVILGDNNDGIVRIDDWATPMLVDPRSVGGPR